LSFSLEKNEFSANISLALLSKYYSAFTKMSKEFDTMMKMDITTTTKQESDIEKEKLDLERKKIELEKAALEIEKQKLMLAQASLGVKVTGVLQPTGLVVQEEKVRKKIQNSI